MVFRHKVSIFFCVLFVCFSSYAEEQYYERPMTILITSHNNKDWYKKNLDMVFSQNYSNYRVIYIDDCSSDKTGDLVEQYIKERDLEDRVLLIKNKKRMFKWYNFYHAVHEYCDDNDIVLDHDGDDWLACNDALRIINDAYTDPNVWLTYGSFFKFPNGEKGHCAAFPKQVIKNCSYRKYNKWVASQQRTFYAWLFKLVKVEDFMYRGDFIRASGDVAYMLAILEMADGRFKFIRDMIYVHNKRPSSVYYTQTNHQRVVYHHIKRQPSYKRLECRPVFT